MARISSRNSRPGSVSGPNSGCKTFTATSRSTASCRPRNTTPKLPSPITASSRKPGRNTSAGKSPTPLPTVPRTVGSLRHRRGAVSDGGDGDAAPCRNLHRALTLQSGASHGCRPLRAPPHLSPGRPVAGARRAGCLGDLRRGRRPERARRARRCRGVPGGRGAVRARRADRISVRHSQDSSGPGTRGRQGGRRDDDHAGQHEPRTGVGLAHQILVGVGLTQLSQLPTQIQTVAEYVAHAIGSDTAATSAVVASIVVYFAIARLPLGLPRHAAHPRTRARPPRAGSRGRRSPAQRQAAERRWRGARRARRRRGPALPALGDEEARAEIAWGRAKLKEDPAKAIEALNKAVKQAPLDRRAVENLAFASLYAPPPDGYIRAIDTIRAFVEQRGHQDSPKRTRISTRTSPPRTARSTAGSVTTTRPPSSCRRFATARSRRSSAPSSSDRRGSRCCARCSCLRPAAPKTTSSRSRATRS